MKQKNWFVFKGDHHIGPFSREALLEKLENGAINENEMVWEEGGEKWYPLSSHPSFQSPIAEPIEEHEEAVAQNVMEPIAPDEVQTYEDTVELGDAFGSDPFDSEPVAVGENPVDPITEVDEVVVENLAEEEITEVVPVAENIPVPENSSEIEVLLPEIPELPPIPIDSETVAPSFKEEEDEDNDDDVLSALESRVPIAEPIEPEVDEDAEASEHSSEPFEFQTLTIPKDTENYEVDSEKEVSEGVDEDEEDTGEYYMEPEEKSELSIRSILLSVLAIIVVSSFAFYFLDNLNNQKIYLKNLSPGAKKSLQSIANKNYTGKSYYRLAPTTDGSQIYLATNLKGSFEVMATFESIKGRVLSKDKVVFESRGRLVDGIAKFERLGLLKGTEIIPGEYKVNILLKSAGVNDKLKSSFKKFPILKELKFTKSYKEDRKYQTQFLLYPKGKSEFEVALITYKKKIEGQLLKPLKEQLERYQTFLSLHKKLQDLWEDYIGRITKGASIKFFEQKYNLNIGPLIRDLVIDSNRIHISYLNTSPEKSKAYEEIMNYGKDIGSVASEMVVKTRRYKRINSKNRRELQDKFGLMLAELKEKGEAKAQFLENSIKNLSAN
ncbi:MAG: DUF4339 domain-containing protein [Oligoflexia bacterium]|nr:DUF4339 domain-containing protein [Oligoflexia bacterium]